MRYIKLFKALCLLSAFVLLASCGGGTGGGTSTGTSTVTLAIGGTGQVAVVEEEEKTLFAKLFNFIAPNEAIAGTDTVPAPDLCFIPPDVHRVVFNISGANMTPINRDIIVNGRCPIIEEFQVPNGAQRIFSADEYSASGVHLYTGATAQNISGADHVQIIMHDADGCALYVDVLNGNNANNDCRNSSDRCETITYALTQTGGNETICVAEGDYWSRLEEGGRESYPLELLEGTTILCEGDQHGAVIHVHEYETGFQGGRIESWNANGASIIGCTIMVGRQAIGIADIGSDITVDDCIVEGLEAEHGIFLRGNSTVKNSVIQNIGTFDTGIHIEGGSPSILNNLITNNVVGIAVLDGDPVINDNTITCNWEFDLFIDNDENTPVNAQNNAWDNFPDIYIEESPCSHDGTDICVSSGEIPDTTGATLADGGCPIVCSTAQDCPATSICVDGSCTAQQTCSSNFNITVNAGQRAISVFEATSLTESINVQLTSDEPSQLSLVDSTGPIVCDPVCGNDNFGNSLNIAHAFTSEGIYGIQVGNFGSAVGTYSLDVTMTGDETVCESIVFSVQDIPRFNVSVSVTGLDAGGQFQVDLFDLTLDSDPVTPYDSIFPTGNATFPFIAQIEDGHAIELDITNPADHTCTFVQSGTDTLTDTITSDVTYDIVCEPVLVDNSCTRYAAVLNADGSVATDADNDCTTASTPCRSITHAMFEIDLGTLQRSPEEIICVGAGPYNSQTGETFPIIFNSTDTNEGQGHDNTTIRCEGPNHSSIIDSSGFFNSLVTPGHGFPITTTVEGCRFTTQFSLSAIESSGNNMFITNNIIDSGFCNGIQIAGGNSTISGNTIQNLSGSDCNWHVGIEILGGGSSPLGVISNNTISGNDMGIVANLTNSLDSLLISQNNIYCNSNYGLLHAADFGATIDAQNNAWNNDGPRVDDHNITGCPPSGQFTDICHYEATSPVLYTPWNAPDPLACPFAP